MQVGAAIPRSQTTTKVLAVLIPALLIVPVFVQLDGRIYGGPADLTRPTTAPSLMPIPISVIVGALAGLWLAPVALRSRETWYLVAAVALMLGTSIALAGTSVDPEKLKLLVFQYSVPMVGFVAGRYLGGPISEGYRMQLSLAAVVALVVPFQLLATLEDAGPLLAPHFLIFGVYGHLQYVPTILMAAYVLSLSVWRSPSARPWLSTLLLALAPLCAAYAAASVSMLAMIALNGGLLAFATWHMRRGHGVVPLATAATAMAVTLLYLGGAVPTSAAFGSKFRVGVEGLDAAVTARLLSTPPDGLPTATASGIQTVGTAVSTTKSIPASVPSLLGSGARSVAHLPTSAELVAALWGDHVHLTSTLPPNVSVRLGYWWYYASEVTTDLRTFLLGHSELPDIRWFPSAHNYYLDIAYHFGVLPLLPLLWLIFATTRLVVRHGNSVRSSAPLFALVAVVAFLLIADNGIRVGLRQPYSGTATFFLWGLLLSRLQREARRVTPPASAATP